MSLATRCSSCGTAFRVVQDQLKVSEGWVRCGRCDAVFNALEGLFDLGRSMPADQDLAMTVGPAVSVPASEEEHRSGAGAAEAAGKASDPIFDLPEPALDGLLDPIDAHLFRKRGAESERAPVELDARDRVEFSDARFDSDLFNENASVPDTTLVEVLTTDAGHLPLESTTQQPDFLRRAERRARWQTTPVRLALGAAASLAALILVLQVANHYRDAIAAQWPVTRPVLAAWCRSAGCALEAPRRIDDVSVESTSLTRAIGLDAFILSVNLRSHARVALATPSIDLSLTDGNGRLIARRALAPRDFGATGVLPAGSETALQVMLNASDYRVAGYTVEIFYP